MDDGRRHPHPCLLIPYDDNDALSSNTVVVKEHKHIDPSRQTAGQAIRKNIEHTINYYLMVIDQTVVAQSQPRPTIGRLRQEQQQTGTDSSINLICQGGDKRVERVLHDGRVADYPR
jgi:hypothetical protein